MVCTTEVNFGGEKGSSLLNEFLMPTDEQEIQEYLNRLRRKLEKYKMTSDHRALAIIGALIVENELDKFLSIWIKGYNEKEHSFSAKVKLAISLKLIPQKILDAIEPIMLIRNVFAHDFEIDTFEQAKAKQPGKFQKLPDNLKTLNIPVEDDDINNFKHLITMITLGLNVYADQLTKIQDYIWKSKNQNRIIKQNMILSIKHKKKH